MSAPTATPTGFVEALRSLGDGLLKSVQDRLQLVGVELQEEKFRLIKILIWISAAGFAAMMALTFASLTVVYLFWESARLSVLIGLTLLYGGAFWRISRNPSPPP
jgi:uncharacterized membrane protein YqjE